MAVVWVIANGLKVPLTIIAFPAFSSGQYHALSSDAVVGAPKQFVREKPLPLFAAAIVVVSVLSKASDWALMKFVGQNFSEMTAAVVTTS